MKYVFIATVAALLLVGLFNMFRTPPVGEQPPGVC